MLAASVFSPVVFVGADFSTLVLSYLLLTVVTFYTKETDEGGGLLHQVIKFEFNFALL